MISSIPKDSRSQFSDENSSKTSKLALPNSMFPMPLNFPPSPSQDPLNSFNLPMVPPHLLLAMQSNLPPEKVKEMLTEQAEMLDQMALKMKSAKEEDSESVRPSKKTIELEKEVIHSEKKFSPERPERRDEIYAQRDNEMLRQEISSLKLREESTYLDLQKAHHQIHMLESQLLELQRKHFSELEHLNFEGAELRRRLEAAEYRNGTLSKENEALRSQAFALKRQLENSEATFEPKHSEIYETRPTKEEKSEYKREFSPEEHFPRKKENFGKRPEYSRNEYSPEEEFNQRKNVKGKNGQEKKEFVEESFQGDKKKEYMPVRTIVNVSSNVTEALTWKTNPVRNEPNPNPNAVNNLQNKFNLLNQEKNKLVAEIEKLADVRGTNAAKRRNDLEVELSICETNINSVTAKLRKLNWLSNS